MPKSGPTYPVKPSRNPRRAPAWTGRLPLLCGLTLLVALAGPATVAALTPSPAGAAPRFLIEAIQVEGATWVSPEVIVSESRLAPGTEYSESELLEAAYRINRLPFILAAGFALDRGSERGKLVLIITVEEVQRFFFGADVQGTRFARALALQDSFAERYSSRTSLLAGARLFTGSYGVLFASAAVEEGVQVGYTRYQLFGRQAFLSLAYATGGCCAVSVLPLGLDPSFSSWASEEGVDRGTLTLGVPLANKNRSLRLEASYVRDGDGSRRTVIEAPEVLRRFTYRDFTDARLELAWIHDTSDDPLFPTRGTTVTAAVEYRETAADFTGFSEIDRSAPPQVSFGELALTTRSRLVRASLSGTRHWPLGDRQAVSLTLRLGVGRSRVEDLPAAERVVERAELDTVDVAAALRHSRALRRPRPGRPAEWVWESAVEVGYERASPDLGLPDNPLERWSVTSGVTYRNRWGIFRFGFAYVDVGTLL